MDMTLTLFDLAGSVALLLWGVHMVQSGIQRAFGPSLRRILARTVGNRVKAFFGGLGVTALLQSSTATGLMVSSFAAAGLVQLGPGLAVMLGANVGTTLIVQLLSFDVTRLAPVLVLLGVIAFRRGETRTRDLGRVAIGLGLMLLALHQLLVLVTPYEDVPSLRLLLGSIATDPLIGVIAAAILTWAAHSSVAVVLLIMSLADRGVVPPMAAFALVLGANIGTALNPLIEGSSRADGPAGRRLPLGNLLTRLFGCLVALPLMGPLSTLIVEFQPDASRAVADFHTAFNLVLALLFLPFIGPMATLLERILPNRLEENDPSRPLYLDAAARETPSIALVGAAREALRMSDVLESMLSGGLKALGDGDRRRIASTRQTDDVLDRLNSAIKAYLTTLDVDDLTDADHRRLQEILIFSANLEQAGDAIDKNLMGLASKRLKRGLALSQQNRKDIRALIERLSANVRTAAAIFMSEDMRGARTLAREKEYFRALETKATDAHFAHVRSGRLDKAEQSALYLDVLRELKRINAFLVAAAAYPILQEEGELLPSRLRLDVTSDLGDENAMTEGDEDGVGR